MSGTSKPLHQADAPGTCKPERLTNAVRQIGDEREHHPASGAQYPAPGVEPDTPADFGSFALKPAQWDIGLHPPIE